RAARDRSHLAGHWPAAVGSHRDWRHRQHPAAPGVATRHAPAEPAGVLDHLRGCRDLRPQRASARAALRKPRGDWTAPARARAGDDYPMNLVMRPVATTVPSARRTSTSAKASVRPTLIARASAVTTPSFVGAR